METVAVGVEDPLHGLRRPDGQSALLHYDLGRGGVFQDLTRGLLPELQVRRTACALAKGLGGRVHTDKDDLRLGNMTVDFRGKEKIPAARLVDNLLQARFVDRELIRLPGGNPRLVDI